MELKKNRADEKVDMTTEDASITNSTSVMMTTVAGDENAIGYTSLGSLNDTVKAVKIDGAEAIRRKRCKTIHTKYPVRSTS